MNLHGVDLNLLVALDALLAERNVTRAAERLSIGQPAMSATLNRLRKLFDDPLLSRVGSELVPTPLAETLVRPVHEAISAIQSVLGVRGSFDPLTDHRTFTLVASDYVGLVLLRPLMRQLARAAPRVRLIVRPVTPEFLADLRRDQIDLALVPQELMPDRIALPHEELFRDRYVCAVDADNQEIGDTVTLEQLRRQPHLASSGGLLPALGQRQLGSLGLFPAAEVSTQTSLLAPFLLAGTGMITLVLERLGRQLEHVAGIRLVEPPVPLETITEAMYWHPRRADDPSHRWLREQLLRTAHEL
ncbi:MAG: Transcriptional regulator, LysR family [Blastococcus sp.]|jgi:DNA-binding transcriptional LysR family regulator|nr:Transcriptional regulator, LysR family [Blastococcus sp.]